MRITRYFYNSWIEDNKRSGVCETPPIWRIVTFFVRRYPKKNTALLTIVSRCWCLHHHSIYLFSVITFLYNYINNVNKKNMLSDLFLNFIASDLCFKNERRPCQIYLAPRVDGPFCAVWICKNVCIKVRTVPAIKFLEPKQTQSMFMIRSTPTWKTKFYTHFLGLFILKKNSFGPAQFTQTLGQFDTPCVSLIYILE